MRPALAWLVGALVLPGCLAGPADVPVVVENRSGEERPFTVLATADADGAFVLEANVTVPAGATVPLGRLQGPAGDYTLNAHSGEHHMLWGPGLRLDGGAMELHFVLEPGLVDGFVLR